MPFNSHATASGRRAAEVVALATASGLLGLAAHCWLQQPEPQAAEPSAALPPMSPPRPLPEAEQARQEDESESDDGLIGLFSAAGDDDVGEEDVVRQVAAGSSEAAPAPSSSEKLRVSDYGDEDFWHTRWDADGDAGYEWYTVSAAELWPVLQPLSSELRLQEPLAIGAAPRIIELGCGLSRVCLDLAKDHRLHGIVATDIVPQAVDVLRAAAADEGLVPPTISFAVENCLKTSYADGSFALVLDKALADSLALSKDPSHLVDYAAEAARLTAPGGYCAVVTAWDAKRRAERCKLFAPLKLVQTALVHRHGPASTHMMLLRRE